MLVHEVQHRGAANPGRRSPVHCRRRVEVVPHDERWTSHVLHPGQCRKRNRLPVRIWNGDSLDRLANVAAVASLGLNIDLPRPPEAVEVVDVVRPELNLQGVDDVLH